LQRSDHSVHVDHRPHRSVAIDRINGQKHSAVLSVRLVHHLTVFVHPESVFGQHSSVLVTEGLGVEAAHVRQIGAHVARNAAAHLVRIHRAEADSQRSAPGRVDRADLEGDRLVDQQRTRREHDRFAEALSALGEQAVVGDADIVAVHGRVEGERSDRIAESRLTARVFRAARCERAKGKELVS
jgi:hypothetical protein